MPVYAWVALTLTIIILIFVMIAYFVTPKGGDSQQPILRVLLSLLAGFGAWFIAGTALFSLSTRLGEAEQMAASGTLGFALFFAVFYAMRRPRERKAEPSITVDVVSGFTFGDTARRIAGPGSNVRFEGFTEEQLKVALLPGRLGPLPTVEDALTQLSRMVEKSGFPAYEVTFEPPIYILRAKSGR